MSKTKKELSKELMFKKIMPSNIKGAKPKADIEIKKDEATVPLMPAAPAELHIKLSVETEEKTPIITEEKVNEFAAEPAEAGNEGINIVENAESNLDIQEEEKTEDDLSVSVPEENKPEETAETAEEKQEDHLAPDLSPPPQPLHGNLVLANIMEDLVADKLDEIMEKFRVCRCRRCRMDVMALALNKLPPKYVAFDRDTLKDLTMRQDGTHIITVLVQAAIAVKAKPRHDMK